MSTFLATAAQHIPSICSTRTMEKAMFTETSAFFEFAEHKKVSE